jgi:hypothetical protein
VYWSAAEQKVHLLLASVMLLNAAETPSSDSEYAEMCYLAGVLGLDALKAWAASSSCQQDVQLQQLSQQHEGAVVQDPAPLQTQQQQHQADAHSQSKGAKLDLKLAQAAAELQLVAAQVEEAMHLSVHYILAQLLGIIT